MLRSRVAAAALALSALAPAAAAAHQGNPNYESVIDSVTPAVPGMQVTVVNRDDRFLLVNRSGEDVLVRGYEADPEPYAMVRADGRVQVNTNSKAHYLNAERDGRVTVPAGVDPTAAPKWKTIGGAGPFEWHDHRMHWMGTERPPAVTDPEVRTKVFDYAVPIEVGGRSGAIAGRLLWTPTPDGDLPAAAIAGFLVVGVGLSALVLVVRRRRGTDDGDGEPREIAEAW